MSLRLVAKALRRPVLRRGLLNRRTLSTAHPAAAPPATDTDEYVRLIFDDPAVWHHHQKGKLASSTGLFGNPHFATLDGFQYAAEQAIQRAQLIAERIWRAPENGPEEMRRVVKNLDRLSDALCSVIDAAELIRNAHPDSNVRDAANQAYAMLCSYMNTLNTDTRLHQVLAHVLQQKSIVDTFAPDEHAAALVFLRDFEKSGIHLPQRQREQFVELSDQILHLGRQFIQSDPRAVPSIHLNADERLGVERLGPDIATDSNECQMVLRYAAHPSARKKAYEALNSAREDSVRVLEDMMRTRAQLARLVGQNTYAELQLQDKMAKSPGTS